MNIAPHDGHEPSQPDPDRELQEIWKLLRFTLMAIEFYAIVADDAGLAITARACVTLGDELILR